MVKEKKETRILWISFTAGLVFAVAEFLFAIYTHSQSVLMDSVYDATELIFIALILFLTPLFYKPTNEKHPYGFYQIESIFLIIKGFMMLSVTFGVSAEIIQSALHGGNPVDELEISAFQLLLGASSLVIYFILKGMNHSLSSPTVHMEIMEWRLDIFYSVGLSLAFFASVFLKGTRFAFLAPYVDPVVAVVVVLLMLPETLKMLWGAIMDIFLFPPEEETVASIKAICEEVMAPERISPKAVDVTRTGRHMWVSIYFETEVSQLSVEGLRRVTREVNEKVGQLYAPCLCELILAP